MSETPTSETTDTTEKPRELTSEVMTTPVPELPEPRIRPHRRGRPSAIWIVPILAIAAGLALGIRTYLASGPSIEITFDTADGLEAGKSEVRYKNVPVGKVTRIDITDDHLHIIARVRLNRGAANLAVKDTQFWVERPRVGIGGISGLGTLLSGAYIGVDVGASKDKADTFTGSEKPPGITRDVHGRRFRLVADDAGSLAVRSPVYLRRVTVGFISALDLNPDGKTVAIEVYVQSPFDRVITDTTVFWNASGIDLTLDSSGLRLDTQSLATVVAGGIGFALRDPLTPGAAVAENTSFILYDDRNHAMLRPDGLRMIAAMRFHQPLKGVGIGTAVDFEGVHLGIVDAIRPGYDPVTRAFFSDVSASLFPERLGQAYEGLIAEGAKQGKTGPQTLQALVGRGLRAQIRSGNVLTGQSYISLGWFPRAKPVAVTEEDNVWVIPTETGGVELQDQLQSIASKIDKIPFDAIGADVHDATRAASSLFGHLDHSLVPEAQQMFAQAQLAMTAMKEGLTALRDNVAAPDSAIQQSARSTLQQIERAAFSLRGLADYVQNHPESLVRGRKSGSEPSGSGR